MDSDCEQKNIYAGGVVFILGLWFGHKIHSIQTERDPNKDKNCNNTLIQFQDHYNYSEQFNVASVEMELHTTTNIRT